MPSWEETVQRVGLHGRVLTASGAPVAGAAVAVVNGPSFQVADDALTAPDGTFVFCDLPSGDYELEVRLPGGGPRVGSASATVAVEDPPAAAGDVVLPTAALAGRVLLASRAFERLVRSEPSLVARWRLGEHHGPVIDDVGGHDARPMGAVTRAVPGLVNGDVEGAVSLDGRTGFLEVPYAAPLNPLHVTVEAWALVTPGSRGTRIVVASRDNSRTAKFRGFTLGAGDTNKWEFTVGDGTAWVSASGSKVSAGRETHLVGTYDGANARIYVDGAPTGASPEVVLKPNAARPLRIGAGQTEASPRHFFAGTIDEVAIYSAALSPDDIAEHARVAKTGAMEPVPLARITLVGGGPGDQALADADGRFALSAVEPGARMLRAQGRGAVDARVATHVPPPGEAAEVTVVLEPRG
jgi:Concanavalin A-like lectin/glucanases superfamily/Carboxypeptidase regulatory-like domain